MNDGSASSGLQGLDYLAVAGYLAVTMWILYRAGRKQEDTEDFFLGGRSMPWLAVGLSIMATLLSTNTYLGAPGEMIKHGPAYFIGFLAYPALAAVVLILWIPFFMRLRLTSAYEYLERRYDRRARVLGNLLFLGLRLGWMSMVVFTAARAMVTMVWGQMSVAAQSLAEPGAALQNDPGKVAILYAVIASVGVAATIYASVGGIRAVIWTDVLQAVMLFGGVAMIIGYVAWAEGTGAITWWDTIVTHSDRPYEVKWVTADISERTTVLWTLLAIFAWNTCTHCSDQVALQRYFTTTSLAAARKSFIVSICSSASIGLLLALSGLALRYFYLQHADRLPDGMTPQSGADNLMPYFYAYQLPAGFGGLILVSFLCDAMQTLGSGVNSIAAIITSDATHESDKKNGKRGIWRARMTTLGVGAAVTVLALLAASFVIRSGSTIFDMLPRMFNMFLGPLAIMFIIGMFYRRATASVILPVVLVTQIFSTTWSWWGEVPWLLGSVGLDTLAEGWISILGVDAAGHPKTPSVMLAIAFPAIFGLVFGGVLSLLFGRKEHAGTEYTWRAVLSRPVEVR